MSGDLTAEQKAFLEECETEFCNRFTDADKEYKLVKEAGIPPPPIVYPWNPKLTPRYRRAGGNRYWKPYDRARNWDREQHSSSRSNDRDHNHYDRNYRPDNKRSRY